jgi:hypothetical protein
MQCKTRARGPLCRAAAHRRSGKAYVSVGAPLLFCPSLNPAIDAEPRSHRAVRRESEYVRVDKTCQ